MAHLIQYSTDASHYDGPFGGGHPWLSAGMGYIFVTDSGKVIAVDGGHPVDAEDFLALIEENSPDATVDTWIVTHPHIDHYSALRGIVTDHPGRIKIKNIVFRFPPEFKDGGGSGILDVISYMDEVLEKSGARHIIPSQGDVLTVGDAEIKFYFTPEDISYVFGKNSLSLIFSVSIGGKKVMITGDSGRDILERVVNKYGEELKCDVIQLPHHGLCDTGHAEFYAAAGADTVLIPTSKGGYMAMKREEYAEDIKPNRDIEASASAVYRSFEGTVKITL